MSGQAMLHEVMLKLSNGRGVPITLHLEPWGDIYDSLPGDDVVIVATGPDPVTPEVVDETDEPS